MWFDDLIAEMVEANLIEEVEPGVYQKPGGHGVKLDISQFRTNIENIPEEARKEFMIQLLAIMEAPELMGDPVSEDELPDWVWGN